MQIGEALGFTPELTREVRKYLLDKGYIEPLSRFVEITANGIDYIENLVPDSDEVKDSQNNRMLVLAKLYGIRNDYWGIDMYELGAQL